MPRFCLAYSVAFVSLSFTATFACTSSSSPADASAPDAAADAPYADADGGDPLLPDGTPPFDERVTYDGEGDACRFSVQCGLRQICVDDACVRHERVALDEIELGEWRRLDGLEWDASPLNPGRSGSGRLPWSNFDLDLAPLPDYRMPALWGPTSRVYPGIDGPQLVVSIFHPSECQVMIIGPTVRVLAVRKMMCSAATVAIDGHVAVAGANAMTGVNEVALFDRDGAQLWRRAVPTSLHERVQRAESWGPGSEVGLISSLYFWEGGLVAAAAQGTTTVTDDLFRSNTRHDWNGLVFLEITSSGEMSIRPVGGMDVVEGWKGWLADDGGQLVAFVNRATGIPVSNPYADAEVAVLNLDSGQRSQLVEQWAYEGQIYQVRPGYWIYQARDTPRCDFTLFDSEGTSMRVPYRYSPGDCDQWPPSGGTGRGRILEIPWARYPTLPLRKGLGYLEVQRIYGDGMNGLRVLLADDVTYARSYSATMGPAIPGSLSVLPGTAAIARYGKTLEVQSIAHGDGRYLAWMEAALRRVVAP